jgi:hypothetical protein
MRMQDSMKVLLGPSCIYRDDLELHTLPFMQPHTAQSSQPLSVPC